MPLHWGALNISFISHTLGNYNPPPLQNKQASKKKNKNLQLKSTQLESVDLNKNPETRQGETRTWKQTLFFPCTDWALRLFAWNVDLFQGSIYLGVVKLEGTSVKYIFQLFEKDCAVVFLLTHFSLPSFLPTCAKGAGSSGNNLKYQAFQTWMGGKNILKGFFFFFSDLYYLWKKLSPNQRCWFKGCACSWGCASEYWLYLGISALSALVKALLCPNGPFF